MSTFAGAKWKNGDRMERTRTQWRRGACHGKWKMHGSSLRPWTQKILHDTVPQSSTGAAAILDQYLGWGSRKIHSSWPGTWNWCFRHLLHNRIVTEVGNTSPNQHLNHHGEHEHGDRQGMSRDTSRIGKRESAYLDYPRLGTKGSATHHHTSCGIASTAWGYRDTTNSCCRLFNTDPLQLGRGSDNQHEVSTEKVKESKTEAV